MIGSFTGNMSDRNPTPARLLEAFAPLLSLASERDRLTAELGVVPLDHSVPGVPATTLLDACEDDADTLVDFAGPDFGFFESEGL